MRTTLLAAMAACGLASACGSNDGFVAIPDGQMVLDWNVASTTNPGQCAANGATTIDITVSTTGNAFVGEFQQDCEAFATSIQLAPGSYVATAVLLDSHGVARTTQVDVAPFTIFGADQVVIPINFPRTSFF